ncbi:response regulator transcription factor [Paenibacillus sp. 22594]|uniref:response regulator transcription factor n=1 Tax=Paenibacillus sp. 22594 TaxID=3453947 RepID=UPI003F8657FC
MNIVKRVIIVDDDIELCTVLKKCLESEGYSVDVAHSGLAGINMVRNNHYELVVLDVMLPEVGGLEVLAELRTTCNMPVLMLSAKDQEMDKVLGLKAGADDYLTKPFSLSELNARVNSLIRRFTVFGGREDDKESNHVLTFGKLTIDRNRHLVSKNETEILLTAKEFELLNFLASHPEQVFSKRQIYQNVWNEEYVYDDNNIMALIRRTRKKVEDNSDNPQYIQTVWGVGYRFHYEAAYDK